MKLYYRAVYWKRRLLGPSRRAAPGGGRPRGYRRAAVRRSAFRARPALVFLAIVAVVLVASAVFGWWGTAGLR